MHVQITRSLSLFPIPDVLHCKHCHAESFEGDPLVLISAKFKALLGFTPKLVSCEKLA